MRFLFTFVFLNIADTINGNDSTRGVDITKIDHENAPESQFVGGLSESAFLEDDSNSDQRMDFEESFEKEATFKEMSKEGVSILTPYF